jgi:MFS family permease
MTTVGLGLLTLGCLLLLAASAVADLPLVLAFTASLAAASAASGGRRGRTWALFYTATYLGEAGPVIGIGLLADHLGLLPPVRIFLLFAAGVCGVLAWWPQPPTLSAAPARRSIPADTCRGGPRGSHGGKARRVSTRSW